MASAGIRALRNRLSYYVRRTEAGERIAITSHGRVIAELGPPTGSERRPRTSYDDLVAAGVIRPALEAGDPLEGWPDLRLPAGTVADLIDTDRGEA